LKKDLSAFWIASAMVSCNELLLTPAPLWMG
jgi:hypothetical protein